jgi:hypothetical protein
MSRSYRTLRLLTLASAVVFAGAAPSKPASTPLPTTAPHKVDCSEADAMKEFQRLVGRPLPANNAYGVTLRILRVKVTNPNATVPNPCDNVDGKTAYTFNFRALVRNDAPEETKLIVYTADLRCELIGTNPEFKDYPNVKLADVKLTFYFQDVHLGQQGISAASVGNPVNPRPGDQKAHDPNEIGTSLFFPHTMVDPSKCRVLINV